MRVYVAVTGTVFGLVVLAHVWRVTVEPALIHDPVYLALTLLASGLAGWAASLLLRRR